MSSQTLHACLSESVAVFSLEVLEQGREFANLHKKYNWQCASAKLAICTTRVEVHQAEPRAVATACIMSSCIAGENNISGF